MKHLKKILPLATTLVLGLSTSFAMAADADTLGERDNVKNDQNVNNGQTVKNGQTNDKPDAYTVDDKNEKGLTNAKKPVRKLHHKQKTKGENPADATHHSNEGSGTSTDTGSASGNQ
jgi:hypothetical protein